MRNALTMNIIPFIITKCVGLQVQENLKNVLQGRVNSLARGTVQLDVNKISTAQIICAGETLFRCICDAVHSCDNSTSLFVAFNLSFKYTELNSQRVALVIYHYLQTRRHVETLKLGLFSSVRAGLFSSLRIPFFHDATDKLFRIL
jgi:hypothetical protein